MEPLKLLTQLQSTGLIINYLLTLQFVCIDLILLNLG